MHIYRDRHIYAAELYNQPDYRMDELPQPTGHADRLLPDGSRGTDAQPEQPAAAHPEQPVIVHELGEFGGTIFSRTSLPYELGGSRTTLPYGISLADGHGWFFRLSPEDPRMIPAGSSAAAGNGNEAGPNGGKGASSPQCADSDNGAADAAATMLWGELCRPGSLVYPACLTAQARSTVHLAPAPSPFPTPLPTGAASWFSSLPIIFGLVLCASSIVGVAVNYGRAISVSFLGREDSEAESCNEEESALPLATPSPNAEGTPALSEASPLQPDANRDSVSPLYSGAQNSSGADADGDRPIRQLSRSDTSLSTASTIAQRSSSASKPVQQQQQHAQADSHELPNMELLSGAEWNFRDDESNSTDCLDDAAAQVASVGAPLIAAPVARFIREGAKPINAATLNHHQFGADSRVSYNDKVPTGSPAVAIANAALASPGKPKARAVVPTHSQNVQDQDDPVPRRGEVTAGGGRFWDRSSSGLSRDLSAGRSVSGPSRDASRESFWGESDTVWQSEDPEHSVAASAESATTALRTSSQVGEKDERFLKSRYEADFVELGRLGRGGYGAVYHVRNVLDGLEYACKKVPLKERQEENEKVLREVKNFARLSSHRNVVRYYHAWTERLLEPCTDLQSEPSTSNFTYTRPSQTQTQTDTAGHESDSQSSPKEATLVLFIQMQLCRLSLSDWLQQRASVSRTAAEINVDAVRVFRQIAAGTWWIHQQGFIHRDIKPANIFLEDSNADNVMLGDFGLSKSQVGPSVCCMLGFAV
jgi:hypothetical protein